MRGADEGMRGESVRQSWEGAKRQGGADGELEADKNYECLGEGKGRGGGGGGGEIGTDRHSF